jgi:hypothetical protein
MLIESLVASIIVGIIRGGRLRRLSYIKINKIWIFIIAAVIQISIILFSLNNVQSVLRYIKELYIFSYILLFIGIILNLRYKSLWLVFIGGILNLVSFIANNGKIPVSIESMRLAGMDNITYFVEEGKLPLYEQITEFTKYSILGDIITVPEPYPFPQILSIGDIVISLGLFLFIQSIMLDRDLERSTMFRFKYRSRI